jgi:ligand-binding sensor domain-containing protein/two-component sensor histidine kinase
MRIAGIICCLLLALNCGAQNHPVAGVQHQQLRFEKFDFRQGLSNPVVGCLFQDDDGFIWAGTPFGLNRFDGNHFENFYHDPLNPNSLVNNSIRGITQDRQHNLWLGTDEGISCFNPRINQFTNYFPGGKGVHRFNKTWCTVYADSDDNIWIGSTSGISVLNASRTEIRDIEIYLNPGDTISKTYVTSFVEDSEYIWAASMSGLHRINRKIQRAETVCNVLDSVNWKGMLMVSRDSKGRIWTCTWSGEVVWWDPADKQIRWRHLEGVSIMDVVPMKENGHEWICIATYKGLIKVEINSFVNGGSFIYHQPVLNNPFSISHRILNDLLVDRSQNLWIGTQNGISKVDPANTYFTVFPYEHHQNDFGVQAICTTDIPNEYYVLAGSYVYTFNREKGIVASTYFGDKYQCYDLFRSGDQYWMTFNGGLLKLNKDLEVRQDFRLPFSRSATENRLRWIVEDRSGKLWISTARSGIAVFDPFRNSFEHRFFDSTEKFILKGTYVENMCFDFRNRLWLATSDGLFIYDVAKNEAKRIALCPLVSGVKDCDNIKCVYEHKKKMYISTGTGLFSYDLENDEIKILPIVAQGVSRHISELVADPYDRLWLNTNNGLLLYDPASEKNILYTQRNGLPYQDLWSPMHLFGNEILTGSGTCILCINTDKIKEELKPPTPVFFSVAVNDTSFINLPVSSVDLQWNESISFNYISLSFNNTSPLRYSYMLEGLDKDWHSIDFNNRLRFSNLPRGNYRLKIKAINAAGVVSAPTEFKFSVNPPFWKTWWFITFCLLLTFSIIYVVYRYRLRQAVRLERLRMRIASDLHDDIGATLSSISMYSDAVKKQIKNTLPHLEPVLNKMGENSRSMVSSMSDIIWAINPNNDDGEKLLERMENYGKDNCSVSNVRFSFCADKRINTLNLPPEQRKNIYLIYKESINNALKYAAATEIKVQLDAQEKVMSMLVMDNGIGFDEERIKKGNGLINMRLRAKEIDAQLNILSGEHGTRILLATAIKV